MFLNILEALEPDLFFDTLILSITLTSMADIAASSVSYPTHVSGPSPACMYCSLSGAVHRVLP